MKLYKFILLCIIVSAFSCAGDVSGVIDISVEDLNKVIERDKKIQLLDVRLPIETREGVILNAINVNLISDNFEANAVSVLDKDKPVYVYCRSGNRGRIASKILIDKGYEVFNIKGGYKNWLKEEKDTLP